MLLSIALPVPLYQSFDYLSNAETLPEVGCRVRVPFGFQTLVGLVVGYVAEENSQVPLNKLKPIKQVIDNEPILNPSMLKLAGWLASYYHYPLGETLLVMLPTLINQGKPLDIFHRHWKVTKNASVDSLSKTAHRQRQQFNLIKLNGKRGASEDVLLMEGVESKYLKILADKGLIEGFLLDKKQNTPTQAHQSNKSILAKLPHTLNAEQAHAVNRIKTAIREVKYQGFLLNGVTGSGKTEVYLQAMQAVLEAGKQVLILVPEIGLTPQTKARFSQRFSVNILLLHSGLSDTARMRGWEDCCGYGNDPAQIIIGTRSALLYPFVDLGLLIVDEAHDQSYKQQDSLRYHASDVALYRGYQLNIPVILGTATPTLEQMSLVEKHKLTELILSKRAGHAKPPILRLVDARSAEATGLTQVNGVDQAPKTKTRTTYNMMADGRTQDTGLTPEVITAMKSTLEQGKQVLVFLNRRGYSPVVLCGACGWQADCPNCDSHLTLHKTAQSQYLKCHHCGYQSGVPPHCPDCHSSNLDPVGIGTTRLTENLHAIFANPQKSKQVYPIIQIDRDTTRRKGSWEKIYHQINQGDPAILVGTQMIAKGHHFPQVTLVVMPNADRGFLSADFRSPEHTAQLIMQVAGRAGRSTAKEEGRGQVLIQTVQPDNPLLLSLVRDGYHTFAMQLLNERRLMGLPPYVYACLIRCEGASLNQTRQALQDALSILPDVHPLAQPSQNNLAVSGVVDAPMTKRQGRYHSQLLILAQQRKPLHQILNVWWQQIKALPSAKGLKLSLDIDPIGW